MLKKSDLMNLVGSYVVIYFKDGQRLFGVLGYVSDFSSIYDFRKPDYFYISNYSFKVSHVFKVFKINVV